MRRWSCWVHEPRCCAPPSAFAPLALLMLALARWHWAGGTVARPYEGSRGGHTSCPVHYHHPVLLSRIAAESAVDLISRLLPVCHVMEKQ